MHPLDIHWVYTFVSVGLVAGASLTGMVALSLNKERLAALVPMLVSLAAGALLGTAFGHLLPESVERLGTGRELSGLLLAGFVTFFLLEKVLRLWCEGHPGIPGHDQGKGFHSHGVIDLKRPVSYGSSRPLITNLLVGAGIHSFIDGIVIATGYTTATYLGVVTTLAVLLHEAPHHIGDVSILIHKGIPVVRAVLLNLIAASASLLGALLILLVGSRLMGITSVLLPFTTANFVYIAAASLMPELQQERGLRQSFAQTALFVAGAFVMFLSAGSSDTH